MRYVICFCLALAGTATAYGQGQQASVQVNGGRIVGTFVPDGGQLVPAPDPGLNQDPQAIVPQHSGGCGCPVCARRVLSQQTRERSKTIREYTVVTVVEEQHPDRVYGPQPSPCPQPQPRPQNSCAQPMRGGGLVPWNQGFVGCRQPWGPPRGPYGPVAQTTRPIVGVGVNVFGIGGSVAVTKTSPVRYYGDPGYGGLGYPSQPVRPW